MFGRTFSYWRRLVGKPAASAQANPQADPEADRRLWVRFATDVATNVQLASNGQEMRFPARVKDISRGGVSLLVGKTFPAGELISLEFPHTGNHETHTVLACVIRVTAEGPGQWAIGCVFSQELTQEDLESFGAKKVRHAPTDKRTWMRFPTDRPATYQKVGDPQNTTYSAQVINLSANGIGLAVSDAVDAGALLSVELQGAEGTAARTMLACAVHVTSQARGSWALGCNFIRQLSEEELKSLV
ncbi:MAG: PilZ domain-containing protein [Planctomycetes bacterium]|nr:PilZ domain-containing protein [Planctomycetota bacterium]